MAYFDTFQTNVHHHDLSPVLLLQAVSGANHSVTNNIDLLRDLKYIEPHQMGGIGSGITCTSIGNYYLTAEDGAIIKVPIFYSADCQESVISPQDICDSNNEFTIFIQQGNTDTGEGFLMFQSKTGILNAKIALQEHSWLCFIEENSQAMAINNKMYNMSSDVVHSMSGIALHHLYTVDFAIHLKIPSKTFISIARVFQI